MSRQAPCCARQCAAPPTGYRWEAASLHRARGVFLGRRGRHDEALAAFAEAVALASVLPQPYEEARALHEAARMYASLGRMVEARHYRARLVPSSSVSGPVPTCASSSLWKRTSNAADRRSLVR